MLTQTKARSGALQGGRVVFLPLSSIRPNPAQPRTIFDAQGLQELSGKRRASLSSSRASGDCARRVLRVSARCRVCL